MSDAALAHTADDAPDNLRPRARATILYGGLAVGVLDILYAFTFWWLKGVGPARILQSISSGLLGAAAYQGGAKTAVLGGALHFLIAFTIAAVYYAVSLKLPVLVRSPFLWGPLYGAAVYFFMNYVVIPLSAVPRAAAFNVAWFVCSVIAHALLVGLPVALLARRSAKAR
jgi:hypothetical protein